MLKMSKENNVDTALIIIDRNFVTISDPGFVDAASGNFNQNSTSPVFEKMP